MPIAIVTSGFKADDPSGVPADWKTSPNKDATGATGLYAVQTLSTSSFLVNDATANPWTQLPYIAENTAPIYLQANYVNSNTPTVSNAYFVRSGNNAGTNGAFYGNLAFIAFSGTASSPHSRRNSANVVSGTSLGTGSVTPAAGGEAIMSSISWNLNPGTVTPPAGYTLIFNGAAYSNINRLALAVKIKGGSDVTAENPTWTWTTAATALGQTDTFAAATATPVITGPSGAAGASSSTANVAENATTGPTFTWDLPGTLSLSGVDAAQWSVVALTTTSARVDPTPAKNFESPSDVGANNVHDITVTVTATAGGATASQTCTITITNVNEAPGFTGTLSVPSLSQNAAMSSINAATFFSDPDSGDVGTYSAVGSWPPGVTVSTSGVISGTPTTLGTYSNLRVRRTDSGSLTADSNLFTIVVGSAFFSVTTTPLENLSGSLWLSTLMNYSWFPGGRIGSLSAITPQEGTATTHATAGTLTISGLTSSGPGVLLTTIRGASVGLDTVHYHQLTAT